MAEALTLAEVRERGQRHAHLAADPTYARHFVRHLSPYATYLVVRFTPLSADAVTALSITSGVAGGVLAAFPSAVTYLIAPALLQLAYLLDVADGEVARVRGTAGLRGTYLDLIGHFVQNRALYAGASVALIAVTELAWWAIVLALLVVGFASPFGEMARAQVRGSSVSAHGGPSSHGPLPSSPLGKAYWLYRRAAFLWNYPASMNLFCIALVVDAVRFLLEPPAPALVLPAFTAAFGVTLTLKQLANAIRLLDPRLWPEPA